MPKQTISNEAPEFVLKHRIVGAAFLLFFSALVLPWVLGPPKQSAVLDTAVPVLNVAEQTSSPPETALPIINDEQLADSIEDEFLNQVDTEPVDPVDTVYISKITPADGNRDRFREALTQADENVDARAQQQSQAGSSELVDQTSTNDSVSAEQATNTAKQTLLRALAEEEQARANLQTPSSAITEAVDKPSNTIDVGWVVQVGVFTDRNGATKVVEDLRAKGFQPSTTIVDTNRGKATGTRVWLGPFAQRVDAAKTRTQLTERTGEPGFIRAYP